MELILSILLIKNHIINGDFELKVVSPNLKWDYYSQRQTPAESSFLDQDQYCFDDKTSNAKDFR